MKREENLKARPLSPKSSCKIREETKTIRSMSSASWKKKLFICVFAFQKKIIINKTFNRLDGPLILCPNDFDPAKNAKKTWRTSVVGEKTECRGFKMEFPCILQSSHIYAWTHIQKWRGKKKHSYTRTRTTSTEEEQSERIIKLCCTPDLCSLTGLNGWHVRR